MELGATSAAGAGRPLQPTFLPARDSSASSCCCLNQFLGKSKPGKLILAAARIQRHGQDLTCCSKVLIQSLAPEEQEPSSLQDLGMSSAGNKCTWCKKFYLTLWGSVMGAEEKAAAGTCWEETYRENWLKAISHPYLSPVPLSNAPCKADSTSSALNPQLSTRGELRGWGKAPWADHRPSRDWHQSCGSTEPVPWQWHEATTQSVTCPDPNPAFPLSMTTKSWRGGSDCQALGWGFGVFVPA